MPHSPKRNIYLSYADSDHKFAERLAQALSKNACVNVRLDKDTARGVSEGQAMSKAIDASSHVVLIVSDESMDSPWVNFEIGVALAKHKVVVPVYLSERLRRNAPPHLAKRHGIVAQNAQP